MPTRWPSIRGRISSSPTSANCSGTSCRHSSGRNGPDNDEPYRDSPQCSRLRVAAMTSIDTHTTPHAAPSAAPAILVLMGVSGSGKSTVGSLLALRLHWDYEDGDWFHPA